MLFTSSLPIGAWYFSVAAQSKMRKSSSPMIPLIARVAKILLQSRKCNSASYSDWVIATPPTETTVYCRIRDSQWQGRRVIGKLSFTKFPHKTKACGNLTAPTHNCGLLRFDFDEIFKHSLLIQQNLFELVNSLCWNLNNERPSPLVNQRMDKISK